CGALTPETPTSDTSFLLLFTGLYFIYTIIVNILSLLQLT
uniref:Uncharacterized protein n=1 Tax=Aegilops tauschii subsp. strangulata TaxID=200361 RepID=A0A453PRP2_AEGTS